MREPRNTTIELIDGDESHLEALRDLFRESNESPYALPVVAREKCFGTGLAGSPDVRLAISRNRLVGASVRCGSSVRILAVARSFRRQGIGTMLLADAADRGRSAGVAELIAGSEPGNYLVPGVSLADSGTLQFFRRRGYREHPEPAVDMRVDLDAHFHRGSEGCPEISRASGEERDRILDFVATAFGQAWALETSRAFEPEPPRVFLWKEEGEILGFSAHDANNRGLGFFGPEGVAGMARRRGIGTALLRASLSDLLALGYPSVVIPWVASVDYYQRSCGATISARFARFHKPLDP